MFVDVFSNGFFLGDDSNTRTLGMFRIYCPVRGIVFLKFFEVMDCENRSEFGFHENCYIEVIVDDPVHYIIELFAIVDAFYIYGCDFPDVHEEEELSCSSMGESVLL